MAKRKPGGNAVVPDSASTPFPNGYGRIVSGELNYLVRQMMEKGPDAVAATSDSWPAAHLAGDTVEAEVIFTPQAQNPQVSIPEDQVDAYRRRMLYLIASMDDLTADTWDAVICQWVAQAKSPDAKVWVSVDDILSYRGLASHVTGGKRGGFTAEQRAAVTESLLRIMSMRLQVFSMTVFEEQDDGQGGRRVLPVHRQIGGPALEVGLDLSQTDFLGRTEIKALLIRPGEMFARYYMGAGRPVALLSQKALTYRQRKEDWEKRLTRYFAYSWDRRSHEGVEQQRHTVADLLKAVHQEPNPLRPEDTKERLEKALRRLTEDRVIAGWDYVPATWDEGNRPVRKWLPIWLHASIEVLAPDEVRQFYSLALPGETAGMALAPSVPPEVLEGQITGESVAA
ncbi:MAG: hypothetical protein ACM3RP_04120, partial [Chitinophagales bacterium]